MPKHTSPLLVLTVGILFLVIAIFGVLQYRWIGEISTQEYERMRMNLRVAAMQCSAGFTVELATMLRTLGPPLPADSLARSRAIEERLRTWRAAATDGRLIAGTSPVHPGGQSHGATAFLQDAGDTLHRPPGFIAPGPDRGLWLGREAARVFVDAGQEVYLFADLTGFAVPVARDPVTAATGAVDFVVFVIDTAQLKNVVLTHLAATTLWSLDEQDYDYCVVSTGKAHEVFALSNPSRPFSAFQQADVVVPFGYMPPFPLSMLPNRPLSGFRGFPDPQGEWRDTSRRPVREWRGGKFEPPPGDQDRPAFARREPRANEGPMPGNALFEMRLRHHSGSLEEHVGWMRARNFGISLGIALVLGASVLVLIVGAERARRLARQQLTFVAGVSHELRTPLAVLKSAGQNLADGVIADPVRARDYGRLISREVDKLTGMVEQALGYAGIQSGLHRPVRVDVDIARIIQHAVAAVGEAAAEQAIAIETDVRDDLPPVTGDPIALTMAIDNLVANAVKHGAGGHWIRVTGQRDERGDKEGVVVTVGDRGQGIPARELRHVFEPFFRGKRTTEEQVRGSGLGLTIARHIVESHGGELVAESEVGHGSVFTLRLPVVERNISP